MHDLRNSTALRQLSDLGGHDPDPPDWVWAVARLQLSGRLLLPVEARHALGTTARGHGRRHCDERWWRADGELSTLRREVGANHRKLSTYVHAAARHGLHVHRMGEPEPESEWMTDRPEAASQPVYLVMDCLPCQTV